MVEWAARRYFIITKADMFFLLQSQALCSKPEAQPPSPKQTPHLEPKFRLKPPELLGFWGLRGFRDSAKV